MFMRWWKPIDWDLRYIGTGDFLFDMIAHRKAFKIPRIMDMLPKLTVSREPIVYGHPSAMEP